MSPNAPVVIVLATQDVDVQRRSGRHGERIKNVWEHFGRKVPDFFTSKTEVGETIGARADVDHRS